MLRSMEEDLKWGCLGSLRRWKGRGLKAGNVSHEDNVVVNVVLGIFEVLAFVVVKVNVRVNRIAKMEERKNAIHERVLLLHHP